MYRISVTTIEKFRRYMTEASEYDTEASLIESIQGVFKGNDKTRVGAAYHKIIEGEYSFVKASKLFYVDGIAFTESQARPALEFKKLHASMVHEIPIRKIYSLRDQEVAISGRIDGLEGVSVRDTKCKFRDIDFSEYLDSYQWRFYLDMTGLDCFYYDLFQVDGFKELAGGAPHFLPDVEFIPFEGLFCHRINYLHEGCLQLLQEFMDYIDAKQFHHFLKTTNETALL